ncbi:MAG: hypothetical protein RSC36_05265, partial [Ruthenibacterium sp.]
MSIKNFIQMPLSFFFDFILFYRFAPFSRSKKVTSTGIIIHDFCLKSKALNMTRAISRPITALFFGFSSESSMVCLLRTKRPTAQFLFSCAVGRFYLLYFILVLTPLASWSGTAVRRGW